jgi:hypothetical protein
VWLGLLVEGAADLDAWDEPWFREVVGYWRVQATVADLGCTLDDSWSDEQLLTVMDLARRMRGAGVSDMVDEVADAFVRLLDGSLPPDPAGAWWLAGAGLGTWGQIPTRNERWRPRCGVNRDERRFLVGQSTRRL